MTANCRSLRTSVDIKGYLFEDRDTQPVHPRQSRTPNALGTCSVTDVRYSMLSGIYGNASVRDVDSHFVRTPQDIILYTLYFIKSGNDVIRADSNFIESLPQVLESLARTSIQQSGVVVNQKRQPQSPTPIANCSSYDCSRCRVLSTQIDDLFLNSAFLSFSCSLFSLLFSLFPLSPSPLCSLLFVWFSDLTIDKDMQKPM